MDGRKFWLGRNLVKMGCVNLPMRTSMYKRIRQINCGLPIFLLAFLCLSSATSVFAGDPGSVNVAGPRNIRNVLLIVSDDLKASSLGCYGNTVCRTPHIDALAKRGMVFNRTYCNATWCAPSRQSFMHSRYQNTGPIGGPSQPNLGEHLIGNGFESARVGKIYHMRVPGDIIDGTDGADIPSTWTQRFNTQGREAHTPGDYACLNLNIFTDALEGRQSTRMPHRMFVTVQYDGDGSDQPDYKAADKAIELLNEFRDKKPFFLAVGMVRPHYPNVAPRKYFEMYPWQEMEVPPQDADEIQDIPVAGLTPTRSDKNPIGQHPDNQKRMWAGYYATVTFMDEQVGRILQELERLGLADSTAVIFTSDHGYHLGEHLLWQKSNLHEEVTRVPLVISAPGLRSVESKSVQGELVQSNSLAELVDLYPTVCDLVGVDKPESLQGKSLISVLRDGNASVRDSAVCQHQGHFLLRTDRWAYMKYRNGEEELYDMASDPRQLTNLAFAGYAAENASTLSDLRSSLSRKLTKIGIQPKAKKKNKN